MNVGGTGKGRNGGGREQRKLREFDALFLSANGTVIVKAAGAAASLVAGEVYVIVSIAGLPRDSQTLLSPMLSAFSARPRRTWDICVPLADSQAESRHTKNLVQSGNTRAILDQPQNCES